MTIHRFADGAVIMTGSDFTKAMEAMINHRSRYDIDCLFCIHEGDEEYCDDCSVLWRDQSCSCHLHAPCSKCTDSKFEVTPYLIDYKHYKPNANGRWRWECIRGNSDLLDALKRIESAGYNVAAETLTTGEISITIEDALDNHDIELCTKEHFLESLTRVITRFAQTLA